jgi:hypothetical protein
MLPHLTKLEGTPRQGSVPILVPPPRFRPLHNPYGMRFQFRPYSAAYGDTASQKAGLRYERYLQEYLCKEFNGYIPGPYIHFMDRDGARTCQPDGILFQDSDIFIFEMKYQHMPEAWWQLERLYAPLVRQMYPDKKVSCVEVCRSYDPAMQFPCEIVLIEDLKEWVARPRKEFGVWLKR